MVTIAFGFIVEHVAVEWRGVTGGQNGLMGIPQPSAFGVPFGERGVALCLDPAGRAGDVRLLAPVPRAAGARACAR